MLFIAAIASAPGRAHTAPEPAPQPAQPQASRGNPDASERLITPPRGHELVWSQEFDTPGPPDPAIWSPEIGFSRNQELQWYQPDNASIADGVLVIEARRERVKNPQHDPGSKQWKSAREFAEYTSCSLTTRGKHQWLYGVFEMRARIDTRPGLWPAWWTLGDQRPWPGCGEIDIMEYYEGVVLANACWKKGKDRWSQHWDATRTALDVLEASDDDHADSGPWSSRFHIWRMEWTHDRIDLFVDGRLLNSVDLSRTFNPDGSNPFREPHHMLVNLAIGGNNGGDPTPTEFPARYEIDYIRVFQPIAQPNAHRDAHPATDAAGVQSTHTNND